jgi:hypothetical protein
MQPIAKNPFRIALLLAAGLMPSHLGADTIIAHPDDAEFQTNSSGAVSSGPVAQSGTGVFIGRSYYADTIGHLVVPFQLPDLGEGTFSNVSLSFYTNESADEPRPKTNVNLWAIPGARTSSTTLQSDVKTDTQNHTQLGTLIQQNFLNNSTLVNRYANTPEGGSEANALAAWLNNAYANGAKAGNFVFLRISPAALTPNQVGPSDVDSGTGFQVSTGNAVGYFSAAPPLLNFTFSAVNPNAPTISSFSASPATITSGSSTTLTWSATAGSTLTLDPGGIDVTGTASRSVSPATTTTYTLTATNAFGSRSASATVTMAATSSVTFSGQTSDAEFTVPVPTSPATYTAAEVTGPLNGTSNFLYVGRKTGTSVNVAGVLVFQLPSNLGPGGFKNATLSVRPVKDTNTATTVTLNYHLYGIPSARDSNAPVASDIHNGTADHRANGTLIQQSYISPSTTLNTATGTNQTTDNVRAVTSTDGSINLSNWLTEMYADGANAGKYVFLRVAQGGLYPAAGTNLGINTRDVANTNSWRRPIMTATFDPTVVGPPAITFTASDTAFNPGDSRTLSWSITNATSATLNDGSGAVSISANSGSVTVAPLATTTYTISATGPNGTRTKSVTLTKLEPGPYRYYRLVPLANRAVSSFYYVFTSEFQLLSGGSRIAATAVTNPGGSNGANNNTIAASLNDNSISTYWYTSNTAPVVYDMGSTTAIDAYRLASSTVSDAYDLVSWRFEGSHDNTNWALIDQQNDYPTPAGGNYTADIPVAFVKPPVVVFGATPSAIQVGASSTLSWNVFNATSVSIDNGIGAVSASGSQSITPANPVTYTLTATNVAGTTTKSITVLVGTSPVAVTLANTGFENNANPDPAGNFGNGGLAALTGWEMISRKNSSRMSYENPQVSRIDPDPSQVAVGRANITPADGNQVLGLMAGAAVGQVSDVKWSALSPGDQVVLNAYAGDRATSAAGNPRWADDSFLGLSDGLAWAPFEAAPANTGWILGEVSRSAAITTPPTGLKSGTMGLVSHVHTVTAEDSLRAGNVGFFIASLGTRDGTGTGADTPSAQSFWDKVSLEVVRAPGPQVNSFTASSYTTYNGGSVTLNWDTVDAVSDPSTITITPGDGTPLPASGSLVVSPTVNTTYTLTASNSQGTKTYRLVVRVNGAVAARYFRFTPLEVRKLPTDYFARKVSLSEFQLLEGDTPLSGATATNPGGSSSSNPQNAVDGSFNSYWSDTNIKPLVLDFGSIVATTGYRFSTSPLSSDADPVSWKLEGSLDGTTWFTIDEQSKQPVPTARQTWAESRENSISQPYSAIVGAPVINSFAASPSTIDEGSFTTLSWDVSDATSVRIVGSGAVNAADSVAVNPSTSRAYQLIATNASGYSIATVAVNVVTLPRGTIAASYDDATYETDLDGHVLSGPNGEAYPILDVGRFIGTDTTNHMVIPFQLPDLGPGGFSSASLSLRTYFGELGAAGRIPIRLFAIPGARDSSATLDSDVAASTETPLTNGYLVDGAILNSTSPLDAVITSEPSLGLGYWLNEAYANGANAGKYVFLRLSPDALDILEGSGFGIASGDDPELMPLLNYAFNPAGAASGPVIANFSTTNPVLVNSQSASLQWEVIGANQVTIDGNPVDAGGSLAIAPTATTTYTLSASDGLVTRTATVTQTVIEPGSFRYLRFTTFNLRTIENTSTNDDCVELTEFQIFRNEDGQRVMIPAANAVVTNPEGINMPGGYLPDFGYFGYYLLDNNTATSWRDFNIQPFTIDYGTYVNPVSYRLGVKGSIYDPVSWRIETSLDGTTWTTIHEKYNQASKLPGSEGVSNDFFFFAGAPQINSFTASPQVIQSGGSTTLSWDVSNTEGVSIDQGIGSSSGGTGTASVSPAATTTYTLTVGQGSVKQTASATVYVNSGDALVGHTFDTIYGYDLLKPLSSTLLNGTPSGSFIQSGSISYPNGTLYSNSGSSLPGLTSPDSFTVLWLGWFNVSAEGTGQYTFGSSGDEGSVIYLDLNGDGDFDDADELIVDNTAEPTGSDNGVTATVNLTMNKVRMAIAYTEESSTESMYARFKKGAGIAWDDLNPISSSSGQFTSSEPSGPFIQLTSADSIIINGSSTTLNWAVEGADAGAVTLDGSTVDATGSQSVSPTATTTYTISATAGATTKTRSVTVNVAEGGLQGLAFGSLYGDSLLAPISNLITSNPSASFLQTSPISYANSAAILAAVSGLGGESDDFSLLWIGSFNVAIDGPGDYTFYTRSDDGSVIYIDRNRDGDFADAGELVVDNNGSHGEETAYGTVNLTGDVVNIAIGYYQGVGDASIEAGFSKGSSYNPSTGLLCGSTSHFRPQTYVAPPSSPSISFSGSLGAVDTTYGETSNPTTITISGSDLSEGITVTAPTGFRVSANPSSGYASSILVGSGGNIGDTEIYIRLAANLDYGDYSGDLVLSSAGAADKTIAIPLSQVYARELVVNADAKVKTYGDADQQYTYSSEELVGDDVLTGALSRAAGEDVGAYAINIGTLTAGANYSITFTGANLTIQPKALTSSDITLTRNGNAYTASAAGVSGFTYSYSGRNATSYGPSANAPEVAGDYTITATITDPNYTGLASEDFTVDEVNPPQDHPAFKVISMSMVGTVCTMTWESQPGASYWIEATDNLADSQSWSALGGSISSQGVTTTVTIDMANSGHAGAAKLFMRVRAGAALPN